LPADGDAGPTETAVPTETPAPAAPTALPTTGSDVSGGETGGGTGGANATGNGPTQLPGTGTGDAPARGVDVLWSLLVGALILVLLIAGWRGDRRRSG
jgi:hypothetical protein